MDLFLNFLLPGPQLGAEPCNLQSRFPQPLGFPNLAVGHTLWPNGRRYLGGFPLPVWPRPLADEFESVRVEDPYKAEPMGLSRSGESVFEPSFEHGPRVQREVTLRGLKKG